MVNMLLGSRKVCRTLQPLDIEFCLRRGPQKFPSSVTTITNRVQEKGLNCETNSKATITTRRYPILASRLSDRSRLIYCKQMTSGYRIHTKYKQRTYILIW